MGHIATLRQPSVRSPERETLADAIKRHNVTRDRLARIKEASEKPIMLPAIDAVEQAEQSLADARKREPKQLVEQLLSDQTASGSTVEEAEWSLSAARASLAQAHRMREALDQQQGAAESELTWAQHSLRHAIASVVKAEGGATKLLAEFDDARREVARIHEVLSFLNTHNCLPPYWDAVRYLGPTGAEAPWRAALAQLEADPDALLPDE